MHKGMAGPWGKARVSGGKRRKTDNEGSHSQPYVTTGEVSWKWPIRTERNNLWAEGKTTYWKKKQDSIGGPVKNPPALGKGSK